MFRQVYNNNNTRRVSITSSSSSSEDEAEYRRGQEDMYEGQKHANQPKSTTPIKQPPPPQQQQPQPPSKPPSVMSNLSKPREKLVHSPTRDALYNDPNIMAGSIAPGYPLESQPIKKPEPKPKDYSQKSHRHRYERESVLRTVLTAFCLFGATIVYCIIGGLMFSYLEESNETAECIQLRYLYHKARNATAYTLYDTASDPTIGDEDKLEAFMPVLDILRSTMQNISWDGRDCENMQHKWSKVSASFFSFTIVSTIGYGHIAPRTNWGRLVSIAYATVGLPLMLLTLAKIGAVFAYYFRAFYFKLLCCGICIQKRRDEVRHRNAHMKRQFRTKNQNNGNAGIDLLDDISSDEEEQAQIALGANIPLLLSLAVAGSSVLIGIAIYCSLEGWSIADSAYFSFISLATIGFGDLVPGYNSTTGATEEVKLIVTAAYIFCGMALLSMALQMMQDEVIEKVKWLIGKARQLCCNKNANQKRHAGKAAHRARRISRPIPATKVAPTNVVAPSIASGSANIDWMKKTEGIPSPLPIT